jgi:ABC-type nitrate/sulfonate/bicarbonate transport system substrate-binding protein
MIDYRIAAGFIPLTDSLLLVIAKEKGFAAAQGVELTLVREISWANIRDRLAVGQFDVAHMLGPMPIAASIGLSPIDVPVVAPMALGLGGNAVTVSLALWHRLAAAGAPPDFSAREVGVALAKVVRAGRPRLRLGVVHPFSSHNYELRYWLAASGVHPDQDVEMVILPPPLMADALEAGRIDGYCVGEPWNSVPREGVGRYGTLGGGPSRGARSPHPRAAPSRAVVEQSRQLRGSSSRAGAAPLSRAAGGADRAGAFGRDGGRGRDEGTGRGFLRVPCARRQHSGAGPCAVVL